MTRGGGVVVLENLLAGVNRSVGQRGRPVHVAIASGLLGPSSRAFDGGINQAAMPMQFQTGQQGFQPHIDSRSVTATCVNQPIVHQQAVLTACLQVPNSTGAAVQPVLFPSYAAPQVGQPFQQFLVCDPVQMQLDMTDAMRQQMQQQQQQPQQQRMMVMSAPSGLHPSFCGALACHNIPVGIQNAMHHPGVQMFVPNAFAQAGMGFTAPPIQAPQVPRGGEHSLPPPPMQSPKLREVIS